MNIFEKATSNILNLSFFVLFFCLLSSPIHAQYNQRSSVNAYPYPRAFFFRQAEGDAIQVGNGELDYKTWNDSYKRLGGIMGKALEEEIPGRSTNINIFTRFKKDNPNQLVLLHYNGNARDPRDVPKDFFSGHWLYLTGTTTTEDLPAESGESEIHVRDTSAFKIGIGRFRNKNDDIGICRLDATGKPNWLISEQVQLLSINPNNRTIRVKRASYNTTPLSFPAGSTYVAAHATAGPFGKKSNLLWGYNFSTHAPRDANGFACFDVLARELASKFSQGGALSSFDGIEFDVMQHERGSGSPDNAADRKVDMDADGRPDRGIVNGINTYGLGVLQFTKNLREKMGENFIIMADGTTIRSQRAIQWINGIESEGWPSLTDLEFNEWSSGMNRHRYWSNYARRPVINYINYKFIDSTGEEIKSQGKIPYSTNRLILGAAQLFDAFFTFSTLPPGDNGYLVGIFDELRKGKEGRPGWLGFPKGAPINLAKQQQNLLFGKTPDQLHWLSATSTMSLAKSHVKFETKKAEQQLEFYLKNIPTNGQDLTIVVTMKGAPLAGFPHEIPRLATASLAAGDGSNSNLTSPLGAKRGVQNWDLSRLGNKTMQTSDKDRRPTQSIQHTTFVGSSSFESTFYFRNVQSPAVDLQLKIEGATPVWIEKVEAYPSPEVFIREFDNGLVLVNPSDKNYSFDLTKTVGRATFKKITATNNQDAKVNDGSFVTSSVMVGPKDSLFLIRE